MFLCFPNNIFPYGMKNEILFNPKAVAKHALGSLGFKYAPNVLLVTCLLNFPCRVGIETFDFSIKCVKLLRSCLVCKFLGIPWSISPKVRKLRIWFMQILGNFGQPKSLILVIFFYLTPPHKISKWGFIHQNQIWHRHVRYDKNHHLLIFLIVDTLDTRNHWEILSWN